MYHYTFFFLTILFVMKTTSSLTCYCKGSTYISLYMSQVLYLLSDRFLGEAIHESHHTMRKVMLSEPGYYFIMLKIRTGGDIHDKKTKLLPMSEKSITVKPVLSGHSKKTKNLVLKTDYCLMQVKSIAECSKRAFCNTFDLH